MAGIKEAVRSALSFVKDMFPDDFEVTLEEVDRESMGGNWLITLGMTPRPDAVASALGEKRSTKYRVFEVDLETGEVLAMRFRE